MRLSVQSNRVHVQSNGVMEELKNIETTWENFELYYISAPKEILKYEFWILNYGSLGKKNPRGSQCSPDFCCMIPPIWESEVSVAKESLAWAEGCWSGTAFVRRRFSPWKASSDTAVHSSVLGLSFRRSVLIAARRRHSQEEYSGKSLPCREIFAIACYPEGRDKSRLRWCALPKGPNLPPKLCDQWYWWQDYWQPGWKKMLLSEWGVFAYLENQPESRQ